MGLLGDYLEWVRSQYGAYGEAIAEQELGVGSDVEVITKKLDEELGHPVQGFADWSIDVTGQIGLLSLDFIKGLGGAMVDGIDSAYDEIRERFIKGREPDIVAGVTIGFLSVLTVVYLYHSVKNAQDAL